MPSRKTGSNRKRLMEKRRGNNANDGSLVISKSLILCVLGGCVLSVVLYSYSNALALLHQPSSLDMALLQQSSDMVKRNGDAVTDTKEKKATRRASGNLEKKDKKASAKHAAPKAASSLFEWTMSTLKEIDSSAIASTSTNRIWAVKNALTRLEEATAATPKNSNNNKHKNIAIFLQLGVNLHLLPDMTMCLANVAAAAIQSMDPNYDMHESVHVDLHVALLEQDQSKKVQLQEFFERLFSRTRETPASNVHMTVTLNKGADIGGFLTQLHEMESDEQKKNYDLFLKIHTKTDPIWRERMLESLCGTVEQVQSIFRIMLPTTGADGKPQLVAPLGTAFGPNTPLDQIFPHIPNKYRLENTEPVFDPGTIEAMNKLKQQLDKSDKPFFKRQLSIVAGTCFWVNAAGLKPDLWAAAYKDIHSQMTSGYIENLGIEHAVERIFPSLVLSRGGRVLDISPAPRPMALYFPQYHEVAENSRFWGEGFTEWTLLRNMTAPKNQPGLKKPISLQEGGLDYYDLEELSIRKRQGDLARQFGVQGFCYYHYWFSGDHAPKDHKVMYKIPEAMMRDGHPNVPFMLSWANEPWTKRWTGGEGKSGKTLLSQTYGDEDEWTEHYEYLTTFFRHPNYVKVDGAPAFAIYRAGHVGKTLAPMIQFWQKLTRDRGDFPGLHIVQTVGNFYLTDRKDLPREVLKANDAQFDGSFQFWPQLFAAFQKEAKTAGATASFRDVPLRNINRTRQMEYWGSYVGFDRRPRDPSAPPYLVSPDQYRNGVCASFGLMGDYRNRNIATNWFFITAWNEWNEQAILEPNHVDRFQYLENLRHCLQHVPAKPI